MAIIDSIKWHIDEVNYELARNAECGDVFIYQRGNGLPHYLSVREACALSTHIRRMVSRSDFVLASKGWDQKKNRRS